MHKLGMLCVLPYILFLMSCSHNSVTPEKTVQLVPDIQERLSSLPETVVDYDRSLLNADEQKVAAKLIEAARPIHDIFLRQVSEQNPVLRSELVAHANKSAFDRRGLLYFDLMMGPWDRLQHDAPFISPFGAAGAKPAGAGFYPPDMTAAEFEKWIAAHPEDQKSFQSLYTVIRRKGGKTCGHSLF